MKQQMLAGAIVLGMISAVTTSALAVDGGSSGHRTTAKHSHRFAGDRGLSEWRHGGWQARRSAAAFEGRTGDTFLARGHYRSLGPLGFTLDTGRYYGYGPGSSIAAWSW
jgi:hypothetical protein